jgi:hypothetical protein
MGLILTTRPDKLIPEMNNVVDYMAYCTKSDDEAVALEACEFWLTFAEDPNLKDQLQQHIGKIAPLLLDGMVYSEYELMYLDVDEEDEAVPDKETDIKPKAYSGKVHAGHETNDPSANNASGKSREAADKALEEDDEDDDDYYDDDDEDEAGEWNVRKCSAAALDVMAVSFGGIMLEILMPHLQQRLFSEDEWEKKESAILALGAVAEGEHNIRTTADSRLHRSPHPSLGRARHLAHRYPPAQEGFGQVHHLLDFGSILELDRLFCCEQGTAFHSHHGRSESTVLAFADFSSCELFSTPTKRCRKQVVVPLLHSKKRLGPTLSHSLSRSCETSLMPLPSISKRIC